MARPDVLIEHADLLADDNFLRLGEFFGLEKTVDRFALADDLRDILVWAKERSGSEEAVDILLQIRNIERQFIKADPTENRIKRLRRYIALEKDQERINKEMELLTTPKTNEPQAIP